QIVAIMPDPASEPADCFHLLGMAQLFLALAQCFFRRAPLLHFADKIVALLEKLVGSSRHLAELRMVPAHAFDRFQVVALQRLHDFPQRLADPANNRPIDHEEEDTREKEERKKEPLVRLVEQTHDWHCVYYNQIRHWLSVPARQRLRENSQPILNDFDR